MPRIAYSIAVSLTVPLLLLAVDYGSAAEPVNHATVLEPFVSDDTFAIGFLNLNAMPASDNGGDVLRLLPYLPPQTAANLLALQGISGALTNLHKAGADDVCVVLGLRDLYVNGGPLLVISVDSEQKIKAVESVLQGLAQNASAISRAMPTFPVQQHGPQTLIVGTDTTVARYESRQATGRVDLTEPLERLANDGAAVAAVFCPGPDFRRVVRELWPELPGSLAPLRGELADRWLRLEIAANRPPDVKPRLVMVASDADAAELFAKLWQNLPQETTEFGGNEKERDKIKGFAQLFVDSLPVKVDGARVLIGAPTDKTQLTKLHSMFQQAFNASMESSRRRERADQFKQIAIAMLNYHDVHKCLPPAAIRDKDGKPLLSWRVAILPYIEQNNLYKQFHLDEPWDSPHNIKLLHAIPSSFIDPAHEDLAREGKTTYQAPVGPETVFYKNEGTTMPEIKDGTANTILLVEVDPGRAVPWTKPDDWNVDSEHPRRGIERTDRDQFSAAFCDGHVQYIPTNVDEKKLRALLTRAGRETINWP